MTNDNPLNRSREAGKGMDKSRISAGLNRTCLRRFRDEAFFIIGGII